eukprot:COSAG02_NODE_36848_length_449_cov_1.800000_1_plen_133_part_01
MYYVNLQTGHAQWEKPLDQTERKLTGLPLLHKTERFVQVELPEVHTLWYRAPELLLGHPQHLPASDMWALGTIFAEILALVPMFPGDSEWDQLCKIFAVLGTPCEAVWSGVSRLPNYIASFPLCENLVTCSQR